MNYKKNILISGSDSRFCFFLKKNFSGKNIFYCNKKKLDITNYSGLLKLLKKNKIKIFIHVAALSRPMKIHEKNINLSILTNIIGTSNVVRACKKLKVKLIYFSTNYVYPCKKGNYKETDHLMPINNYGWSKLGGECAVHMLKDALILRLSITNYPFDYKKAINNTYSSLMYNKDFAKILPLLLNEKGVLNIGGKRQTIYNFAKKDNPNIQPISKNKYLNYPKDSSVSILKMKRIIKRC